ncbi:hypothetical protein C8R45DRAFT_1079732 [Mycena sanguinolenta]|nr:hypothetical protein C8R45DRAFT_1079732 [Mycena sanguinolenta]
MKSKSSGKSRKSKIENERKQPMSIISTSHRAALAPSAPDTPPRATENENDNDTKGRENAPSSSNSTPSGGRDEQEEGRAVCVQRGKERNSQRNQRHLLRIRVLLQYPGAEVVVFEDALRREGLAPSELGEDKKERAGGRRRRWRKHKHQTATPKREAPKPNQCGGRKPRRQHGVHRLPPPRNPCLSPPPSLHSPEARTAAQRKPRAPRGKTANAKTTEPTGKREEHRPPENNATSLPLSASLKDEEAPKKQRTRMRNKKRAPSNTPDNARAVAVRREEGRGAHLVASLREPQRDLRAAAGGATGGDGIGSPFRGAPPFAAATIFLYDVLDILADNGQVQFWSSVVIDEVLWTPGGSSDR